MKIKISYTYEIITPESAINCDAESRGWAYFNGFNLEVYSEEYSKHCTEVVEVNSINELKEILSKRLYFYEGTIDLENGSALYGCDPDRNYHDGSETYFAAHLELIKEKGLKLIKG